MLEFCAREVGIMDMVVARIARVRWKDNMVDYHYCIVGVLEDERRFLL